MWIWLHFSEINYTGLAVIFIISLINYSITRTRTNEIAIAILLMILVLYRRFPKKISLLLRWLANDHCAHAFVFIDDDGDALPKRKKCFCGVVGRYSFGRIRLGAYAVRNTMG